MLAYDFVVDFWSTSDDDVDPAAAFVGGAKVKVSDDTDAMRSCPFSM